MHTFYITTPQERPHFGTVIAFLWHASQDVDTDGNSRYPGSRTWTELYIKNRDDESEVADVSQHQAFPLVLKVESERQHLAARAAFYLSTICGGNVSSEVDGEYHSPESLEPLLGDFNIPAALQRAEQSQLPRSSLDHPFPKLDGESMV